jgi:hypothetical protein
MRDRIRQLFPRLETTRFDITSPPDTRYNCVAWAAGDTRRWWWPGEVPFSYWPAGVRREESVDHFIEAFATMGYELAASGDHDYRLGVIANPLVATAVSRTSRRSSEGPAQRG